MKGKWFKGEIPENAIGILRPAVIGNGSHNSGKVAILPDDAENWHGTMDNTETVFEDTDKLTVLESATPEQAAEMETAYQNRKRFWKR